MNFRYYIVVFSVLISFICSAQNKKYTDKVNVFLGTSGDHGQLSPGASTAFGLMSIAPQTYPTLHTGYEHKARRTLGFTHNRFEGTGC